ncbi:MAG: TIGR04076 family protein [Candidatus Nezhaarchaeales archaeon]
MVLYRVLISVMEIKGSCPVYKVGDKMTLEGFYIVSDGPANICIHALTAMMSLLSAFSHGASARDLGIGSKDDEGYVQCPDPGPPYTEGGTVVFRLKRLGAIV